MRYRGKRKIWLFTGLFAITVLMLPSCTMITEQDFLALNDRVVALSARVSDLENTVDKKLSENVNAKIEPVRTTQAELVAELDKVKEQIQELSGKVEENNLLIRRSVEKDTTTQDMIKAELAELRKRVEEMEAQVKEIRQAAGLKPAPAGSVSVGPGPETRGEVAPGLGKKPAVGTEQDLYDNAMALFKEGKYEEAIAQFRDFLKKYPSSDLSDNAQFWIGESYMAMKQYEKAILAYQEVIKKYPDGNKVPSAMLKQALAFYEIKDKVSARLLLKKIIRKYPNSEEARIAAAKLKTLK